MTDDRPAIPAAIKREVRQRCGFGCVLCGLPLYTYEHMLGWAEVKRHVAEEMTLLCDQHQREKTSGLLPAAAVAEANASPFNLRAGVSTPYTLHFSGSESELSVGSNSVLSAAGSDFAAVMVDEVPLICFRFEDGHYLLNVLMFDSANDLVVRITDNELVFSAAPWDVEFVGTRLVIRAAAGDIFADLRFEPPNRVVMERGRLLRNGVELLIRPEYALLVNNASLFRGTSATGCSVALNLGTDTQGIPSAIRCSGIPRYGVDRDRAIDWAHQQTGLGWDGPGGAGS